MSVLNFNKHGTDEERQQIPEILVTNSMKLFNYFHSNIETKVKHDLHQSKTLFHKLAQC
jgi:hypothetical protein